MRTGSRPMEVNEYGTQLALDSRRGRRAGSRGPGARRCGAQRNARRCPSATTRRHPQGTRPPSPGRRRCDHGRFPSPGIQARKWRSFAHRARHAAVVRGRPGRKPAHCRRIWRAHRGIDGVTPHFFPRRNQKEVPTTAPTGPTGCLARLLRHDAYPAGADRADPRRSRTLLGHIGDGVLPIIWRDDLGFDTRVLGEEVKQI